MADRDGRGAIAAETALIWLLASAPVLATVVRVWSGWRPVGDTAAITLRAGDVFSANTPLVGMPTTLSDSVGQVLHHPGPAEFWAIGLLQLVSQHRTVPMLAVVGVNLTAVAAIIVMAGWLGGRHGRLLAAATVVACTWSLRGDYLVDPYNPYAAWIPLGALAVALVALLAGRSWALPVAVGFGTYAAQSHVSLLVPVAAMVLATVVCGAARAVEDAGGIRAARSRALDGIAAHRRPALTAAAILVWLWSPVLADLIGGRRNLLTLVGAAGADGPVLGVSRAWQVVARAITSPPWLEAGRSPFETVAPVSGGRQILAALMVAAAVAGAAAAWRQRSSGAWLVAVAIAGLAGGTAAASRIPGGIFAAYALHNYLWLWPFTAAFWVGVLVLVAPRARLLVQRLRPDRRWPGPRQWSAAASAVLLVMIVAIAALSVATEPVRASVLAGRHAPAVASLGVDLGDDLASGGPVVVQIDAELDQAAVAMGLVLELERRGVDVRVEPALANSFGEHRVDDGAAMTRLVVVVGRTGPPPPPSPGLELLANHEPARSHQVALAQASAPIERRIRDAGGLVIGVDGERLELDRAIELVRTGDLVGLARLGLVVDPRIPTDELSRYADAQEGPILHVAVFR